MILHLQTLGAAQQQHWLQYAIAPRPIALVSTVNKDGDVNLAPFSFFNLFSADPPVVIFSPARRVRDNTTKHSLENLYEVPEAVVHVVTYEMAHQVVLASADYPRGVNEMEKAGFTALPAVLVRPPLVKESPVRMECRIREIRPLGQRGGAGNLVIGEILVLHIDEHVLNAAGNGLAQERLDLVSRLGGDWWGRTGIQHLFQLPKLQQAPMGMDQLPAYTRHGDVFRPRHLAQLAMLEGIPALQPGYHHALLAGRLSRDAPAHEHWRYAHELAAVFLDQQDMDRAWQVLLEARRILGPWPNPGDE